mmetsp:Transcript_21546/g.61016  ORF Transcript_21546/g.61016 Transcript_21546/m.61016 type:complete len:287 (+) Transcript_21546:319-1179(+)
MRVGLLPLRKDARGGVACRCNVQQVSADALLPCPVPRALVALVQALLAEVVAVGHVLGVAPGGLPQPAIKLQGRGVRRVAVSTRTSEALRPQPVDQREVLPLHGQHMGGEARVCLRRHWGNGPGRWRRAVAVAPVLALAGGVVDEAPEARSAIWVAAVVQARAVGVVVHDPCADAGTPLCGLRRPWRLWSTRRNHCWGAIAPAAVARLLLGDADAQGSQPNLATPVFASVFDTLAANGANAPLLASLQSLDPEVELPILLCIVVHRCSTTHAVHASIRRDKLKAYG